MRFEFFFIIDEKNFKTLVWILEEKVVNGSLEDAQKIVLRRCAIQIWSQQPLYKKTSSKTGFSAQKKGFKTLFSFPVCDSALKNMSSNLS